MSVENHDDELASPGTFSEERLSHLLTEACKHPAGSPERQKNLTKIIRLIKNELWKENTPYYQDALQQTWLCFCQNICERHTGNPNNLAHTPVIEWLNFYLKERLHDYYISTHEEKLPTASTPRQLSSGETNSIVNPDVPPLIEQIKRWVETDPEGELRRTHIPNHPEVTCQVLILRRLPPELSWKSLAVEFNLSISTLSGFYQRQCLPKLRKFSESRNRQ